MKFDDVLQTLRHSAIRHGAFLLRKTESINDAVVREGVSKGFGVYVISGRQPVASEVLYIGKAGTICQDGGMKEQGIQKRLVMKQDGIYRKDFFPKVISERNLESLRIEWFETYSNGEGTPPFFVEADLLVTFLRCFGRLPALNKEA